jgi:hypothetical protein
MWVLLYFEATNIFPPNFALRNSPVLQNLKFATLMTLECDELQNKLQHFQNDLLNIRCPSLISKLMYLLVACSLLYALQHLNMIVAVDLTGGIVLYSGMNLVGKVHVAGIPSALTTSSYLSLNLGSQFDSSFPRYVNVITLQLF